MADITVNSKVGIGLVVVLSGAGAWLHSQFNNLNLQLSELKYEVKTLQETKVDTITKKDLRIYNLELQKNNPSLKVPEVE